MQRKALAFNLESIEDNEVVDVNAGWGEFYPLTAVVEVYKVVGLNAAGWTGGRDKLLRIKAHKMLVSRREIKYKQLEEAARLAGYLD